MFLRNSQCKSQHFICGCTWILIMGAWKESQHWSQQFDKAHHEYKQHMTKGFYMQRICHMALVGNIHHWGLRSWVVPMEPPVGHLLVMLAASAMHWFAPFLAIDDAAIAAAAAANPPSSTRECSMCVASHLAESLVLWGVCWWSLAPWRNVGPGPVEVSLWSRWSCVFLYFS
jgi:hypothetical protein